MGNFFSDLFGGKKASIDTKPVVDPSKTAVSNPLSAFLASDVGKGLPRYDGELTAGLPQGGGASVDPFLGKTVDQLYNPIQENAVKTFKNNYSDLLEGSAGALSSSSRAYNDNTALTNLNLGLADKRAALELGLPAAQYDIASKIQAANTAADQAKYQEWYKSLPENNPILEKALSYLNNTTSTGTDILSALDPGTAGILGPLISAAATAIPGVMQANATNRLASALK